MRWIYNLLSRTISLYYENEFVLTLSFDDFAEFGINIVNQHGKRL